VRETNANSRNFPSMATMHLLYVAKKCMAFAVIFITKVVLGGKTYAHVAKMCSIGRNSFMRTLNLPALPFPMTEEDIDEFLPEISRGRDGLLVIVPLQEQQKRPPTKMKTIIPVPLVSKKGGVKKPKMTAATTAKETASTSAPEPASMTAATTAEKNGFYFNTIAIVNDCCSCSC